MLNELDKKIIRRLQEDLPLCQEPYNEIAQELGIDEALLFSRIEHFIQQGVIRKIGAALKHRELGFQANAMVVWEVEEKRIKEVGKKMAEFQEVSHCYQRPTYPDWPFSLFTMIHGKTQGDCEEIAGKIAYEAKLSSYQLLYSSRELKKTSMRYFCE